MRLIGMMDSPYVRRVAVSLKLMDLPFVQEQISVFRQYDRFAAINPVVKAPSFVTDDGVVLMESTVILEYLDRLVPPERRLVPAAAAAFLQAQRVVGLALTACEKAVQLVYEHNLRPAEARHQPWIDRVHGQMLAAYRLLDAEVEGGDGWLFGPRPLQADITAAVAWRFARHALPDAVTEADHPALAAFSRHAEATPAFASSPLE